MEHCLERDKKFGKVLKAVQIIYLLTGVGLTIWGIVHASTYEILLSAATLLLFPGMWLVRKIFHWQGGLQMETWIYVFSYLGWTLGGAASMYRLLPGFDKVVHCLSGCFVSMLALTMYRMLERRHSKEGENKATACLFVFFASVAVAGLFELCEFVLAPLLGRDLQHVLDTGVGDTIGDIFVCSLGTLVYVLLMIRAAHGKHDPFTDAAEVFALQNPAKEKDGLQHEDEKRESD